MEAQSRGEKLVAIHPMIPVRQAEFPSLCFPLSPLSRGKVDHIASGPGYLKPGFPKRVPAAQYGKMLDETSLVEFRAFRVPQNPVLLPSVPDTSTTIGE